ncbi:protein phosphatase 1M isoform X7 [Callithrix jacchus]|uniref:protein phosphatase 1M isoform X6 n=2 Tax=Callithrix jacchus TaxID=9483 RepID=UPI00159D68B5|nr:protein phosphatase 1M isoform X6 [Callithrix jacchus]
MERRLRRRFPWDSDLPLRDDRRSGRTCSSGAFKMRPGDSVEFQHVGLWRYLHHLTLGLSMQRNLNSMRIKPPVGSCASGDDEVIGRELEASGQVGGCTALVAVSLQGKLYVANAGDSRAILVRRDEIRPLSSEFTPETERQRIQQLAFVYPELLAGEFTRLEFPRRLKGDDLGQKVLFRDHHMRGWSYKRVDKSDLKYPLIHGQGRQARLLGTLAVSRGLGDHQLRVLDTNIQLKPFLLSVPQVTVLDVDQLELQEDDVVVMATDGLWDVLSNEQVAWLVRSFLPGNQEDPYRFLKLAQMLIHSTQGKDDSLTGEGQVSYDDVSVFVIPLHSQGQDSSGC